MTDDATKAPDETRDETAPDAAAAPDAAPETTPGTDASVVGALEAESNQAAVDEEAARVKIDAAVFVVPEDGYTLGQIALDVGLEGRIAELAAYNGQPWIHTSYNKGDEVRLLPDYAYLDEEGAKNLPNVKGGKVTRPAA